MSSNYVLAKRYARAFLSILKENKRSLQDVVDETKTLLKSFKETGLDKIILNPVLDLGTKKELIEPLKNNISSDIFSLLEFLIDKNRFFLLPFILQSLEETLNEESGRIVANLEVATPLTDELKSKFIEYFKKKFNAKTVDIVEVVNEKIIGGFRAKIGDYLIDASIKGSLDKAKRLLLTN
ncbi:ATP synthase F1 subcomplex delta subunit [Thermodesulfobium acidiphilum]|uniref:ATP synthase subunit delta n=1 Tax=Thermodesulfobium acidiphilum TaxID=1794699 RepID=A0A2R4VZF9_THEAF|nr:ATP synthase F1 subunit delta [Thermodesulfobium acidiphilum]AWB09937.1 ATP synthase F1 subcomplex delta subunit [Thermodesulfobium acidiphilum]